MGHYSFDIDASFNDLLLVIQIPIFFIKMGPYQQSETILEITIKQIIYMCALGIKFSQDSLQIFQMSYSIYDIFRPVLAGRPQFTSDIIDKSLRLINTSSKKSLKVLSRDWIRILATCFCLYCYHLFTKRFFGSVITKKNSVVILSSRCSKIVFALLYKIITLYMQLISKHIWFARLQGPLFWLFTLGLFLHTQNCLQDPLQVLLSILQYCIINKSGA